MVGLEAWLGTVDVDVDGKQRVVAIEYLNRRDWAKGSEAAG